MLDLAPASSMRVDETELHRPTEEFAAFCGQLGVGWVVLGTGDAEAKGLLDQVGAPAPGSANAQPLGTTVWNRYRSGPPGRQ